MEISLPVDVDEVGELLESEKGDTDRQNDLSQIKRPVKQQLDIAQKEVEVLQIASQHEISRHPQHQRGEPPVRLGNQKLAKKDDGNEI